MTLTFPYTGTFTLPAMDIDLLFVRGCPHRRLARRNLDAALVDVAIDATIREREVRGAADAARWGMHGSPTLLIDGRDPFENDEVSLSCRLFRDGAGVHGAPSVAQLREVLAT
jgi:hypothetical protein